MELAVQEEADAEAADSRFDLERRELLHGVELVVVFVRHDAATDRFVGTYSHLIATRRAKHQFQS